ncbi:MAG TPA: FUSC family protein [Candidatus Tumulicola sp.]
MPAIVAVVLAFGATYAICVRVNAGPAAAVLAVALAVGLSRSKPLSLRSLLTKIVTLPLIALTAGIVGYLLMVAPPAGAALFCAGIALSVWLRQYGAAASALGRTIALPFMLMLVVPVPVGGAGSAALAMAAGVLALASTALVSACVGWFANETATGAAESRRVPRAARQGELPVATRMALQMLAALVLAFAIGLLAFPSHWPWIVLTAFIVCSGAVGRGDAIYKGTLRFGGAFGGTLAASIVAHIAFPNDVAYAAVVFAVLFLGIALRQINYAYWAACATLIFALLQGSGASNLTALFFVRMICILIGALCGIVGTWFVYPIRTEHVVRRRVADALAALREVVTSARDGTEPVAKGALLDFHVAQLERIAPPVRLHRVLFGAKNADDHPAALIERTRWLLEQARAPDFDRSRLGAELRRLGGTVQGQTRLR